MANTYLLTKSRARFNSTKARRICRVAANVAFRFLIVMGFGGVVFLPDGMDQGVFGLGGFLLLELLMMAVIGAGILGEAATHVDLPLDGGEEDE